MKMAPPLGAAELPLKVLALTISVALPELPPKLMMPPPPAPAELPLRVLTLMSTVALRSPSSLLLMPRPLLLAELPLSVQLLTVNVEWSLKMPPPLDMVEPLVMVRLEMLTTRFELIRNTRLAALPSTARLPGPGPT